MKILQVNNFYAEKSTGKLTAQLHRGLQKQGHTSLVAYGRGRTVSEPGITRLCSNGYAKVQNLLSRFTGLPYGGCVLSTGKLLRLIAREKPDVVHLQCINGYFVNIYRLVAWLKKKQIPTVVSLHAEFMYTANCGHAFECDQWKQGCHRCPDKKKATKSLLFDRTGASWRKMQKAFQGFSETCIVTPVSPWTYGRARQGKILAGLPMQTVLNGVDTDIFCAGSIREKNPTVLHVTAAFNTAPGHNKGGIYLAELAKSMPEVTFWVAGVVEEAEALPGNLKLLGEVTDQRALAELYRRAWVSILVSRKETFSMPCAESLCCGTPVVGFKAGAPEQIALAQYSRFAEYGDLEALKNWLQEMLGAGFDREALAQEAACVYSEQTMVQRFLEVYEQCLHNRIK